MDIKPLITIGTIFYNAGWAIEQYLQGITNLDYPKDRIDIVWVDSSNDITWDRLKDFQDKYNNKYHNISLYYCKRDTRKGKWKENIVKARNMVINKRDQTTDLIFLDCDCIPPSIGIEKLLDMRYRLKGDVVGGITVVHGGLTRDRHTKQPVVLPVFSGYIDITKDYNFTPLPFCKTKNYLMGLPPYLREKVVRVIGMATGFMLVSKEVLDKVKFRVDQKIGEDLAFVWDASELGYNCYVNTALWYDHLHYNYTFRKKKLGWLIIYKGENPARFNWDADKYTYEIKHKPYL